MARQVTFFTSMLKRRTGEGYFMINLAKSNEKHFFFFHLARGMTKERYVLGLMAEEGFLVKTSPPKQISIHFHDSHLASQITTKRYTYCRQPKNSLFMIELAKSKQQPSSLCDSRG